MLHFDVCRGIDLLMHFEDFISRFRLDSDYGFVGKSPMRRLPGDFMVWENIADNLQALTATNQLRSTVDKVLLRSDHVQ